MHNVQHAHIYQLVYVHFTPPEKCQGFWAFCNITVTLAFIPLSTALHFSPICEHIGLTFSLIGKQPNRYTNKKHHIPTNQKCGVIYFLLFNNIHFFKSIQCRRLFGLFFALAFSCSKNIFAMSYR